MKNKKLVILVVLVILGVILLGIRFFNGSEDTWICQGGEWVKHGNPDTEKPLKKCLDNLEDIINFDQTGHLVMDNPGMKAGVWFLVYEKSGMPALTAELVFDDNSECKYNGKIGQCPNILLLSSALTRVQGVLNGGVVRVIKAESGK